VKTNRRDAGDSASGLDLEFGGMRSQLRDELSQALSLQHIEEFMLRGRGCPEVAARVRGRGDNNVRRGCVQTHHEHVRILCRQVVLREDRRREIREVPGHDNRRAAGDRGSDHMPVTWIRKRDLGRERMMAAHIGIWKHRPHQVSRAPKPLLGQP